MIRINNAGAGTFIAKRAFDFDVPLRGNIGLDILQFDRTPEFNAFISLVKAMIENRQ